MLDDWTAPQLSLALALLLQFAGLIWWASKMASRVEGIEEDLKQQKTDHAAEMTAMKEGYKAEFRLLREDHASLVREQRSHADSMAKIAQTVARLDERTGAMAASMARIENRILGDVK